MENVKIVKYNPEWPVRFRREVKQLRRALGKSFGAAHHIGSTAIRGLTARDQVDILLVVRTQSVDGILTELGYRLNGSLYEKPGFTLRMVSHTQQAEIDRYLAIRSYLVGSGTRTAEFAQWKQEQAERLDATAYGRAKDAYFARMLPRAEKWVKKQNQSSHGMSIGMCIGLSLGLVLGNSMGNPGVGMCMGMALGMSVGLVFGANKPGKEE